MELGIVVVSICRVKLRKFLMNADFDRPAERELGSAHPRIRQACWCTVLWCWEHFAGFVCSQAVVAQPSAVYGTPVRAVFGFGALSFRFVSLSCMFM